MRRMGFSLVEVIFALLLFQVGLLGTAGMIFMAQQNLLRAELTVRGILEAGIMVDSLERGGELTTGERRYLWGEVSWAPSSDEIGGVIVHAISTRLGDTLVVLRALIPPGGSFFAGENLMGEGRGG